MAFKERVFSGVQPTGNLHLGNYLGAIVKFVELQNRYDCIYCVVDLHAITVPMSVWGGPTELRRNTREVTAAFIAAGIDPVKHIVFNQSQVSIHAELAWVFNCVARLGWLDRMTQFKEKAGKHKERESVGLYTYPVLQAADILVYKATHVPVGEDQRQHLELTRDIAAKFNHDFDAPGYFPLPEALTQGPGARIMSLRDGAAKMSKSDPSDNSRINLTDDADTISQKIRKARTDQICKMLIETTLPVGQIAESLSFNDVQHFSRYFRSAREISPLAYRKSFGTQVRQRRAQNGDVFSPSGVGRPAAKNLF
jgi:tryptophanyl-tRNA synthetase